MFVADNMTFDLTYGPEARLVTETTRSWQGACEASALRAAAAVFTSDSFSFPTLQSCFYLLHLFLHVDVAACFR